MILSHRIAVSSLARQIIRSTRSGHGNRVGGSPITSYRDSAATVQHLAGLVHPIPGVANRQGLGLTGMFAVPIPRDSSLVALAPLQEAPDAPAGPAKLFAGQSAGRSGELLPSASRLAAVIARTPRARARVPLLGVVRASRGLLHSGHQAHDGAARASVGVGYNSTRVVEKLMLRATPTRPVPTLQTPPVGGVKAYSPSTQQDPSTRTALNAVVNASRAPRRPFRLLGSESFWKATDRASEDLSDRAKPGVEGRSLALGSRTTVRPLPGMMMGSASPAAAASPITGAQCADLRLRGVETASPGHRSGGVVLPPALDQHPVSTRLDANLSKANRLNHRAVPPVSTLSFQRGGSRTVGHGAVSPVCGASLGGAGSSLATSSQTPLVVHLTGDIQLDGRKLGRLTASSQARDASLPAHGPSRVNLHVVPTYSGAQVPR